jgi:XXXCH domain-containing protein
MDFSALKAKLDILFAALQQTTEAGELPALSEVTTFVLLVEKMHMNAPDDWLNEAEDFLHLARQLLFAVKHGRVQDAVLLLDALQDAREFCHRTYGKPK